MSKLRIAIAGAGYIGQAHMAAAQSSDTCTLSAIVDPSPGAVALANAAGVPLYRSLEDLFAADRPDGIVLATPNQFHVPHAMLCLDAGLPMLLEKPVAPTLAEGEQLVKTLEESGGKVLVGHHRAHSPIMAKACEVVASGQLGRLVTIVGSATFFKPDQYFKDAPWRSEKGAGPLLLNMIHEVHSLRMLCGEIAAVQAIVSNSVRGFPVEDTVAVTLRFVSGALGTFMLSDTAASARSWEQTSQENKAYSSYDDEDCYVISGTNGSLSVPTMRLKTYARAEDRSWWKPFDSGIVDMARTDPLKLQMEHFGAVIAGTAEPLVTVRDGWMNLRVTDAIVQAGKHGGTVELIP